MENTFLIQKTQRYLELFASKNIKGLEDEIYNDSITLRDWNGQWVGKQAVLQMNEDLFNNEFTIEIEDIKESEATRTTIALFNLTIADTTYKVVDIIEWDAMSKIYRILAYAG
jgi:hypothetical protein